MHFDASGFRIDLCQVFKVGKIKIGTKFAIHTCEQVQVKGCRYAKFVVIRRQQL